MTAKAEREKRVRQLVRDHDAQSLAEQLVSEESQHEKDDAELARTRAQLAAMQEVVKAARLLKAIHVDVLAALKRMDGSFDEYSSQQRAALKSLWDALAKVSDAT